MKEPTQDTIDRCQTIFAHAWMVRTFVKHSPEAEEFPELMGLARTVFDTSRALEIRVNEPPAYLQMLRKKIGKLRQAAADFRRDAPLASSHTNFQQAVVSIDGCVRALEAILAEFPDPRRAVDPTDGAPASDSSGPESAG